MFRRPSPFERQWCSDRDRERSHSRQNRFRSTGIGLRGSRIAPTSRHGVVLHPVYVSSSFNYPQRSAARTFKVPMVQDRLLPIQLGRNRAVSATQEFGWGPQMKKRSSPAPAVSRSIQEKRSIAQCRQFDLPPPEDRCAGGPRLSLHGWTAGWARWFVGLGWPGGTADLIRPTRRWRQMRGI